MDSNLKCSIIAFLKLTNETKTMMKSISIIGGRALFVRFGNVNLEEVLEKEDGEYVSDEIEVGMVLELMKNEGNLVSSTDDGDIVIWNDNSTVDEMWKKLKDYYEKELKVNDFLVDEMLTLMKDNEGKCVEFR
jgi:hypothetical protein